MFKFRYPKFIFYAKDIIVDLSFNLGIPDTYTNIIVYLTARHDVLIINCVVVIYN